MHVIAADSNCTSLAQPSERPAGHRNDSATARASHTNTTKHDMENEIDGTQ